MTKQEQKSYQQMIFHKDDNGDKYVTRKERERAFRRNEILLAARDVFAQQGFTNATLDEIAEKAEFGKGTIYNYFQSKDELFEAVIIDGYESILRTAEVEIEGANGDIRSTYLRVAKEILGLLMSDAGIFMLFMREFHKPVTQNKLLEHYPKLVSVLERPLILAIERGEVKKCQSSDITAMFISSMFSAFKWRLMKQYLCCEPHITQPTVASYTEAQQKEEIANILELLDLTFFQGILDTK